MKKRLLTIKICGYRTPQRYAVERSVRAALGVFKEKHPEYQEQIIAVSEVAEILKYTQVLILPSLLISDELACSGRFLKAEEIINWSEDISAKE